MNKQVNPYRFISDSSHGWLEVPMADVIAAGVATEISAYSYISVDGQFLYLEEDCDALTFVTAYCASHPEGPLVGSESSNAYAPRPESWVRGLPHFDPEVHLELKTA